jgi:hypothetical protein
MILWRHFSDEEKEYVSSLKWQARKWQSLDSNLSLFDPKTLNCYSIQIPASLCVHVLEG